MKIFIFVGALMLTLGVTLFEVTLYEFMILIGLSVLILFYVYIAERDPR